MRRVLFVTSNGTGFGHLTRAMAIGRRLEPGLEPAIFTLSAAAPVVRRLGFAVDYLPSYRTPGAGSELAWHRRLRARVGALVDELDPGVLVFDGVHPYAALLGVLHDRPDLPAVWCRRAMWQPGAGREFLATEDAFDAVLEPSISRRLDLPAGVVRIADTYPMSRYYRAFDLTVSASGYNAFHELVRFGVPTLFVPMPRELDDQAARARWAERAGVGVAVEGPDSPALEERLDELLDPERRERIARRAAGLGVENGAEPAARMLSELSAAPRPAGRPARRPGWRYRPFFYAWMLARAPAHHLFGFGYRSPRAVCLALGCPEDELLAVPHRLPSHPGV